jgi:hypothetical protein
VWSIRQLAVLSLQKEEERKLAVQKGKTGITAQAGNFWSAPTPAADGTREFEGCHAPEDLPASLESPAFVHKFSRAGSLAQIQFILRVLFQVLLQFIQLIMKKSTLVVQF